MGEEMTNHPAMLATDEDRRDSTGEAVITQRARSRALLALGCLLLLMLPVGFDTFRSYTGGWRYVPLIHGDGTFVTVLAAQERSRMVNIIIGLAARDTAGRVPRRLWVPERIEQLSSLPPDGFEEREIPAMQPHMIRYLVGRALRHASYDPRLPSKDFDNVVSAADEVLEHPMGVYGLRFQGLDHRRLIAISDSDGKRIALVPTALGVITLPQ